MKKDGISRIVVLVIILIIFSYFSIGYTYDIYNSGIKQMRELHINTNDINNISIDGSDFTWMFRLLGIGSNALLSLVEFGIYCIYAIIITIVSLILSILFRCIGLKKASFISGVEKAISKWLFGGFIIVSVITGLILTRLTVIIPLLVYTAIWAVLSWFIYVNPLLKFIDRQ